MNALNVQHAQDTSVLVAGDAEVRLAQSEAAAAAALALLPQDDSQKSDASDLTAPNELTAQNVADMIHNATELDGSLSAWLAKASLAMVKAVGELVKNNEKDRKKLANLISQTRTRLKKNGQRMAGDIECGEGNQMKLSSDGIESKPIPAKKSDASDSDDKTEEPKAKTTEEVLIALFSQSSATLQTDYLRVIIEAMGDNAPTILKSLGYNKAKPKTAKPKAE